MFQDTRSIGADRATLTMSPRKPRVVALQWVGCLAAFAIAIGLVLAPDLGRRLEDGSSPAVADTLGAVTPTVGGCSSVATSSSRNCIALSDALHASARVAPAWVRPVSAGGVAAVGSLIPAVLTLPAGWRAGDPAAVVVAEQPWAEQWRNKLADEMLAIGTAVFELDVYTARGLSADSAAIPPSPTALEMLPDLFGALQLLAGEEFRAGAVIALGRGVGGAAALLAARDATANHHLESGGPRFAAAASLDGGCEWTTTTTEAPTGWRAEALHFGTVFATAGLWTSEPAPADTIEAASLACAAALVLPASSRPQLSR